MEEDSVGSLSSEQWELCIENIPGDLQYQYAPFVAGLSFIVRVHLYQILESLNYSEEYCSIVLDVMKYVKSNCDRFIQIGHSLHVTRRPLYFYICRSLRDPQLTEFLSQTPVEIVTKLMEIAFYISESDVKNMIHLILDLSVQEFNLLIDLCNEPFAKHCRLCRSKKSYQLEYRLLHEQISDVRTSPSLLSHLCLSLSLSLCLSLSLQAHCTLPGILPLYEKAEIWQADNDSKFYTFNYERGVILWRRDVVDLIKICDKCLIEIHAASSEVARSVPPSLLLSSYLPLLTIFRFEAYHHEEGLVKKHHVEEMRNLEQHRAALIGLCEAPLWFTALVLITLPTGQIAKERVRRRVREWSIRALKCQREGYLREEQQRKTIEEETKREEMRQKYLHEQTHMIHTALSTDKYWIQQEKKTQLIRNQYKDDLHELKTLPKFTRENPMKPVREHPHSWRLTPYGGKDGRMPIERDAVSKVRSPSSLLSSITLSLDVPPDVSLSH
jgi:hypothetical protein